MKTNTINIPSFLTAIAFLASAVTACADTIITGGAVSGTWTATNSPYIVTGNISVSGALTIEQGVVVQFQGATKLTVTNTATISVLGTTNFPVLFTAATNAPTPGDWAGIEIVSSINNTFSYATIEYAIVL